MPSRHTAKDPTCPLNPGHCAASAIASNGKLDLQAINAYSRSHDAQPPPQPQPASKGATRRRPATFETLPPEIRLKIYEPLIDEAIELAMDRSPVGDAGKNTGPPLLAIMCTNSKIYREFKHALWSQVPMALFATRARKSHCLRKSGTLRPTPNDLMTAILEESHIHMIILSIPIILVPFQGDRAEIEKQEVAFYKPTINAVAEMLSKAHKIDTLCIGPGYKEYPDKTYSDTAYSHRTLSGFIRALANFPKMKNVGEIKLPWEFEQYCDVWGMVRDLKGRFGDDSDMLDQGGEVIGEPVEAEVEESGGEVMPLPWWNGVGMEE